MVSAWRYYRVLCKGNEVFVRATSPSHAKQITLSISASHNKWGYQLTATEWDIEEHGIAEINNTGASWIVASTEVPTGISIY
jgi:hypothetical protein